MSDESTHEERQDSAVEDFKQELEELQQRAVSEREAAKPDEGETEEEYRQRIASVPGIFGDIDTTAGASASGTDVVSRNNELATQSVAEAEAAAEEGDEDAQEASVDEARRQVDVAGGQPSAEEVDAAANDEDDKRDGTDAKDEAKATAGNDDDAKKSSRKK